MPEASLIRAVFLAPPLGGAIAGVSVALMLIINEASRTRSPGDVADGGFAELVSVAILVLVFSVYYGLWTGMIVGIPLMSTIGLLVDWGLRSIGWTQWWVYMFAGATCGLILVPAAKGSSQREFEILLLASILGGAFTAAVAWRIRRPDRTCINNNQGPL